MTRPTGDIVLVLVRDLQLPIEGVTGGYLVYREGSETLYALDATRTVTGRRPLDADTVAAALAPLYHTGVVVPHSAVDHARLVSTIAAVRAGRRRPRSSGAGLALVR